MRIGVLGSGAVGREVAERLKEAGHEVRIGTRDPEATLARSEPDAMGFPPFAVWHREHDDVPLVPFEEAGAFAELVVNATSGLGSVAALTAAGVRDGTIVIDLSNPLDFSAGFPPGLVTGDYGSLGEELQARVPAARIVKVLNTVGLGLMFRPDALADGDHTLFMAGDDGEAKATVRSLLEGFGWTDILDLGDISAARETEMLVPLYLRTAATLGHVPFNFKVVR